MAKKIRKSKKISKAALHIACTRYPIPGLDEQGLEKKCKVKGLTFVDSPVTFFSYNDEKQFWKQWEKGTKQKFISQLVYRPVY